MIGPDKRPEPCEAASIAIVWRTGPGRGEIELSSGKVSSMQVTQGDGKSEGKTFSITGRPCRLELILSGVQLAIGAYATVVTVRTAENTFSFFLRDVSSENPIYLPQYGLAVTSSDSRTYEQIADDIKKRECKSDWQRFRSQPEETYRDACERNRDMRCPTWLGLSRDMRIFSVAHFELHGYWGYVQPRYHSVRTPLIEEQPRRLQFAVGRGAACRVDIARRLDEGVLPILHSRQIEDDVTYDISAFATLETRPIAAKALRGSDWRAAYRHTGGNMLTE